MQPYIDQPPQVVVVPQPVRERGGAEMAMLVILFVMVLANLALTIVLVRALYVFGHPFG